MKIIGIFLFLLSTFNSAAQWLLNYSDSTKTFTGIQFVNNQTGYAIGDYSQLNTAFIMRTSNAGQTWTETPLPSNFLYVQRMYFYNDSSGYVIRAGTPSVIAKTINWGQSWTLGTLDSAYSVTGMSFVNDSTGFILNNEGRLRKVNNHGASYNYLCDTLPDWGLLLFPDGLNGFAAQEYHVLRSNNSGNSWFYLPTGLAQPLLAQAMAFCSATEGYVSTLTTSGPNIYKTINAAQNWQQVGNFNAEVMAANGNSCVAVNNNTTAIVYTKNGGFTWHQDPLPVNFSGASGGAITPNGFAYLINEGRLYKRNLSVFANYNATNLNGQNVSDTPLKVYPNPATDFIFTNRKQGLIEIYDVCGQLVLQSLPGAINISSLKAGLYSIRLKDNGSFSTQKFVKQ